MLSGSSLGALRELVAVAGIIQKEDGYVKCHRQGGARLYDTRRKDVQESKVLPHPLFSRSVYLDPEGTSILLNHPMA